MLMKAKQIQIRIRLKVLALLTFLLIISFSITGNKTETKTQSHVQSERALASAFANNQTTTSLETDTNSFAAFISLFDKPEVKLPDWAVESFLNSEKIGRFSTKEVLETNPVYLLLYAHFMPVGPGMDRLHAVSFTKEGTLISDVEIGTSYPSSGPDGGGKDYAYDYDTERHVLAVTNTSIDWDEENQEEVSIDVLQYYLLDEEGSLVSGRKYPQVSENYLDAGSLNRYSKEELKIMRNEIFAVYGYIFKTEPMKSHYGAMRWYKPQYANVEDRLTDIEKANVQLIKQIEDQK